MKTTLILRDDLVRRAKSRAALRGQPLSRYVEESLEKSLKEEEEEVSSISNWIDGLPSISNQAARDLKQVLGREDFRAIDSEMWG